MKTLINYKLCCNDIDKEIRFLPAIEEEPFWHGILIFKLCKGKCSFEKEVLKLDYMKERTLRNNIIAAFLWTGWITKIMNMFYEHDIWSTFKNLAINHKVNWFFSSCSFVVNILILPFKDPFYYANEDNGKTLCLRERAAFCRGARAQSSPHLCVAGCQARGVVLSVIGCGVPAFWLTFSLWLTLVLPYNFPSPALSMPAAAASWAHPAAKGASSLLGDGNTALQPTARR